jgi:hypothetical protein
MMPLLRHVFLGGIVVMCFLSTIQESVAYENGEEVKLVSTFSTVKENDLSIIVSELPINKINIEFLEEIWRNNKIKYPSLAWHFLSNPYAKLVIADHLLQAKQRGYGNISAEIFRSYALEQFYAQQDNRLSKILIQSIVTLGAARKKEDIPLLVGVVRKEEFGSFEAAITALCLMESPEANTALASNLTVVKKKYSKVHIEKAVRQCAIKK